ncbi:MAG: bifunctional methylenetetrahydrofolate dehydrogenase/methenyltetrahydrofolate cyclohydrolase FolD [Hyphomicrobiales bacterium]|nr:bifunctional methylenetetrahydrofolate dehydrogenase/methenyltetrahydrofolate cyclohydrolase FolD [Hyphomicrobiales bacterium]
MTAQIIDGKAVAAQVHAEVAAGVAAYRSRHQSAPGLAVVLVGNDPASEVYVRNKARQTEAAGMVSIEHRLDAATSEDALLRLVAELNRRADVHGILVQLPLPAHIDAQKVLNAIDPDKDVDGFHPVNAGRLSIGEPSLVPCTPQGCIRLAKSVRADLKGLEAVVIGRSNIVGKPVAQLLLREDCTVTIAHSRTRDLPAVVRRADLVVAAVGRPQMVKADWIKPGAILIDVGINRIDAGAGRTRLVGDVDYDDCVKVAGAITPVPGGVGPMTIACLLANTLAAARTRAGDRT